MAQKFYQKTGVQAAIVGSIGLIIVTFIPQMLSIPKLKGRIKGLESKLAKKDLEIQQLEIQLTPYRTLALDIFGGSEVEALAKLLVRFKELDSRISELKQVEARREEQAELRKLMQQTAPIINVQLMRREDKTYILLIESENLIPFRARWLVVTENNKVTSGVMIGTEKIYPTEDKRKFTYKVNVDESEISNNFLELRFRWYSLFYEQQGKPEKLKGEVTRVYKVTEDKLVEKRQ